MGLYEIQDINELLKYLPGLVKLFEQKKLDGLWKDSMTSAEFVADLTNGWQALRCFGLLDKSSNPRYFFAVSAERHVGTVWIFFVDYEAREQTKNLFHLLKNFLKESGLTEFRFHTRKLTRSYDRWISKLGAEKFQVTYQIKL